MTELGKLGAEVEEGRDYCIVHPPKIVKPGVAIDTYDDHRMVRQSPNRSLAAAWLLNYRLLTTEQRRKPTNHGHSTE